MKEKFYQFLILVCGVIFLHCLEFDIVFGLITSGVFVVACCLVGLILDMIRTALARKLGVWVLYITFIGVILHELSHAILATLTGAKVTDITLFQIKSKSGTLGEVKFKPRGNCLFRGIQTGLASVAPMFTGAILLFCGYVYLRPLLVGWQLWAFWYLAVSIFMHMSLSKQDVKNIFANIFSILLLLVVVFSVGLNFIEELKTIAFTT